MVNLSLIGIQNTGFLELINLLVHCAQYSVIFNNNNCFLMNYFNQRAPQASRKENLNLKVFK